jgi:hypothetical protein
VGFSLRESCSLIASAAAQTVVVGTELAFVAAGELAYQLVVHVVELGAHRLGYAALEDDDRLIDGVFEARVEIAGHQALGDELLVIQLDLGDEEPR